MAKSNNEKSIQNLRDAISKKEAQIQEIEDEIMTRYRKDIQAGDAVDSVRQDFEKWSKGRRREQGHIRGSLSRSRNQLKDIGG